MKVLFVAAEAAPLAKVGGLADVAGALPKELVALGHDVRVVLPSYPLIESDPRWHLETAVSRFSVPVGATRRRACAKKTEVGPVQTYLIGSTRYFQQATESSKIYVPGAEPYIFFCRGVVELVRNLAPEWTPDVLHCNDWHTGLIPVYLRTIYESDPVFAGAASVLTIHNLAHQGEFEQSVLATAGLPASLYNMHELECYGKVNFLKGGIVFSDLVNTVSRTYACEIQTKEFGCKLDGLLRHVSAQGRLRGILNGLDYREFNPKTDGRIHTKYAPGDLEGKLQNKLALQNELGLPEDPAVPLLGLVSRLADQKGLDLIAAIMPRLMELDVQFVLVGAGDPAYETRFKELGRRSRRKMRASIGFDAALAQRVYAGADVFLMPSRFEPCGLGQMIALRYGTIPVVRATGGLADTIQEFNPADLSGNGFVFSEYDPDAFFSAVMRAVSTYESRDLWQALASNAAACDFSCRKSALDYVSCYEDALARRRAHLT